MPRVQLTDLHPVPGHGRAWAALQFPLTRIVVAAVSIAAVVTVAQLVILDVGRTLGLEPTSVFLSLFVLAAAVTAPILYVAYVRWIERRPAIELGDGHVARELGAGFAFGLGLFAATIAFLVLGQVARIDAGDGLAALVPGLLLAAAAAVSEEIVFRGVVFRILEERLGSWIALPISAALFGALHLVAPHASFASALGTALQAGVLLGAAYMCTRRLWLPIAIHAGWRFARTGVFGPDVAGAPSHAVWSTELSGPAVLTGGDHGLETSVVAVILCLTAAVGLLAVARRRGFIVRPAWADRSGGWIPL
jgi:uncharacterized protein